MQPSTVRIRGSFLGDAGCVFSAAFSGFFAGVGAGDDAFSGSDNAEASGIFLGDRSLSGLSSGKKLRCLNTASVVHG